MIVDGTFGMVLVQRRSIDPPLIGASLLLSIALGGLVCVIAAGLFARQDVEEEVDLGLRRDPRCRGAGQRALAGTSARRAHARSRGARSALASSSFVAFARSPRCSPRRAK